MKKRARNLLPRTHTRICWWVGKDNATAPSVCPYYDAIIYAILVGRCAIPTPPVRRYAHNASHTLMITFSVPHCWLCKSLNVRDWLLTHTQLFLSNLLQNHSIEKYHQPVTRRRTVWLTEPSREHKRSRARSDGLPALKPEDALKVAHADMRKRRNMRHMRRHFLHALGRRM